LQKRREKKRDGNRSAWERVVAASRTERRRWPKGQWACVSKPGVDLHASGGEESEM